MYTVQKKWNHIKIVFGGYKFHFINNQWNNIEYSVMKLQNEIIQFRRCFIYSFNIFLWHGILENNKMKNFNGSGRRSLLAGEAPVLYRRHALTRHRTGRTNFSGWQVDQPPFERCAMPAHAQQRETRHLPIPFPLPVTDWSPNPDQLASCTSDRDKENTPWARGSRSESSF
jgi:hypothetical protein